MTERHARWSAESAEAMQARTDAFMAAYKREDYTFSAMHASRRLIAHPVAAGVPVRVVSRRVGSTVNCDFWGYYRCSFVHAARMRSEFAV